MQETLHTVVVVFSIQFFINLFNIISNKGAKMPILRAFELICSTLVRQKQQTSQCFQAFHRSKVELVSNLSRRRYEKRYSSNGSV
jgi:hypothetical protein